MATAIERFASIAKMVGCPKDQVENFLSAGYVPQPKQLEFHAAARQCDIAGGCDQVGFGGARGPGKSHATFAQVALDDCRRFDGLKALYLRKVGKQAREQFGDLARKVLSNVPYEYKQSAGVLEIWNDSRIFVGHFKDEKDIDNYLGIEYDVIAIEEATTLSQSKYKALRDSNRSSKPGWRPRVYATTNPGGIGHAWFKQRFVTPWQRGEELYTRFVPATVDDNVFNDEGYRRRLEENVGWKLRAYRFGDWDIAAGQFFTPFRTDMHVIKPFDWPSSWQHWCALDYGFTHPTVCYLVAQDGDGNIYTIDEHRLSKALVPQHAKAITAMLARNRVNLHSLSTFVAGADVFARRGVSSATIADQYAEHGIILSPANDDRINGAGEVLQLLGDESQGIPAKLFIFDRCTALIECLPAMEHDPNRPEDVLKVDVDEDGNGGDDCFVAGTLILTRHGKLPIESVRPGDEVLTRAGWKPVISAWKAHRSSTVLKAFFSDGSEIVGTPNHPFWVADHGWVYFDSLRYGDIMVTERSNQFYRQSGAEVWQNQNVSNLMGLSSAAIQTLPISLIAATTRLMRQIGDEVSRHFIRRYGRRIMGLSPRDIISIIETTIRLTMALKTWNACTHTATMSTMPITPESLSGCVNILRILDYSLPLGTRPTLGSNGIGSMVKTYLEIDQELRNVVSSAAIPMFAEIQMSLTHDSAQIDASQHGDELAGLIKSNGPVPCAASHSPLIDSANRRTVVESVHPSQLYASETQRLSKGQNDTVRVVDVVDFGRSDSYALHIADQHEYYANSLLVRNCYDAARYAIMAAKKQSAGTWGTKRKR